MENTSHSFDEDFEKINYLFDEYSKSVNFVNVADFKSAKKTQLTNQVWKTLYKVPKNRKLMENNAADFVDALNNCIKACLNRIQTDTMTGSFSQYIYNTIPLMLLSAARKEQTKDEHIVYSQNKTKIIREITNLYEQIEKCGITNHKKIIEKISVLKSMSVADVEKYYNMNMSRKISINQQYEDSEEENDILSQELGKQEDIYSPENEYMVLNQLNNVFSSLDTNWKALKKKSTETENDYQNKKAMLSDLLTTYILKEYQSSFEKRADINSYSTIVLNFDITAAGNKYSFLNKKIIKNFIESEEHKLPTQNEISAKYFPNMKKDAVSHMRDRFIEKAVEKLK